MCRLFLIEEDINSDYSMKYIWIKKIQTSFMLYCINLHIFEEYRLWMISVYFDPKNAVFYDDSFEE